MPTEPTIIVGAEVHHHMFEETTWGEVPGSPTYVPVPFTEYSVRLNRERRNNQPYLGEFGVKHGRTFRGFIGGTARCPLYTYHPTALGTTKSLGAYLLEWGLSDPTAHYLRSRGIEVAAGPDVANKLHKGLRVNSMTIAGSDDSGMVELSFDLMGYDEAAVATAQAAPGVHHGLLDIHFGSVVMTIDAVTVPITDFQIQRQHGLKFKYRGSTRPLLLAKTIRRTSLSFTLDKDSDAYDIAARLVNSETEYDIQIEMQGLHGGTGPGGTNYTKFAFDLPQCQLIQPDDAMGLEDIATQTISCDVLEPDGAGADLTLTVTSPV